MIQTQGSRDVFYGNGFARDFSLSFPAPDAPAGKQYIRLIAGDADGKNPVPVLSNFLITRHGDTLSVRYPVAGEALAQGMKLTIYRQLPLTQPTDLENGGNFYAETIEDSLDWLEMQIQQLDEVSARAVKVPISSDQSPEELLAEIFDARDTARTKAAEAASCRDAACACADLACACAADAAQTVAGLAGAGDAQVSRVLAEGDQQVRRVTAEGDGQAQRAANEADRAENAARAIPGFAQNAHAFFGLNVNAGGEMILTRSEDGDTLSVKDFAAWAVFPAESRLYLAGGNGGPCLMLELPFQL
jgi:hypothetical protein